MTETLPTSTKSESDLRRLIEVAQGHRPGDLAVINARLVNVYSGELQAQQAVVTSSEWIAYVGDNPQGMIGSDTTVIDAKGRVLIPGLIDGHTHLAWFYSVAEFLRFAMPGGTTTIITETLEPYPVCGLAGVLDFLDSLADQPIKLFATAPAMVSISRAVQGIFLPDLEKLLARKEILGLGESYWQGVLQAPEHFLKAMVATQAAGKTLEGHSAGARGGKLAAYAALGITSCHEPISAEDVITRLRLGMHVMAREGSIRSDLAPISRIKDSGAHLRRLILATDGVEPEALMQNGYMESVLQKAIDYGFDPIQAVQMVTLNVAEHFGIDHLVGGIAPGRSADMVLIPDLTLIRAETVISRGRIIARNGELLVQPRRHRFAAASCDSIRLPREATADDFAIRIETDRSEVEVRVIEMTTDLVTQEQIRLLPVVDGQLKCHPDQDLIKVAAIDRTHTPGKMFTGLLGGFRLRAGALGCSAAWDTSDIIVVGTDEADMAACVNRIRALKGGAVIVGQQRVLAEMALPVFGLVSDRPMETIAAEAGRINRVAKDLGLPFANPLLTLITLTGAAIPYMRICEEGLVNLKNGLTLGLIKSSL
jgi:adenine deaminase